MTEKDLDDLSLRARQSPRRRKNLNFHDDLDAPCQRFLNAVEPGTYLVPHRHLDPEKAETLIAVRGRMGVLGFEADGTLTTHRLFLPEPPWNVVNIPAGDFHSLVSLEPGSIFFEAKAGPYSPISAEEKGFWAPAEAGSEADQLVAHWTSLFS